MKFIVIGAGSIGQRHIKNLLALDCEVVAVCDPSSERHEAVKALVKNVSTFSKIEDALQCEADAVLICTPSFLHAEQTLQVLHAGFHLFIEKPISHSLELTDQIIKLAVEKKLKVMVGCNLRFYPSLLLVKELLAEEKIGKVLSVQARCGYFLPFWRPQADYRESYSAKVEEGGGIILDAIHEFDYLHWMFGDASEVFCYADTVSSLEINTEDCADILLKFNDGFVANLHLDYLQKKYSRTLKVIGEAGEIVWDFERKDVTIVDQAGDRQLLSSENPSDALNKMYLEERKYFINCVNHDINNMSSALEAIKVLKIALAAKLSANTGEIIKLT